MIRSVVRARVVAVIACSFRGVRSFLSVYNVTHVHLYVKVVLWGGY